MCTVGGVEAVIRSMASHITPRLELASGKCVFVLGGEIDETEPVKITLDVCVERLVYIVDRERWKKWGGKEIEMLLGVV